MRRFLPKAAIIGWLLALLTLLGGCGALRLAYSNGPQLAWWWLDGYVDFARDQSARARQGVDRWFEWHRTTQLAGYADLLAVAQPQVLEPATPALACRWQQQVLDRLEPALDRALQQAANFVPGLGAAQFEHIEERFAKANREARRDFLQPDPGDRRDAAVKRALDRAEQLYGRLDAPQKRVIEAGVAASPFDPQAWIAEREARQRDVVQTLRRLVAERADNEQVLAALRALAERFQTSPDPAYRAYQQRLGAFNCAFAAQVHNATTPAQRRAARDRLRGWEEDLRLLAARPAP